MTFHAFDNGTDRNEDFTMATKSSARSDWLLTEIDYCQERANAENAEALEKLDGAEALENRAAELRAEAGVLAWRAAAFQTTADGHRAELSERYCSKHDLFADLFEGNACPFC